MHSGTWRLGHRPGLDGLRGVAILLVLATHLGIPGMTGAGSSGVTVFFVLSGFLIASLLLEEADRTGGLSFAGFYRRRAARLLPALFAFIGAVVAVMLVTGRELTTWLSAVGSLLYFNNWVLAIDPKEGGTLALTWSLAIEEQFYLVAPVVMLLLFRRPRLLMVLAGCGAAASVLLRLLLFEGGFNYYRIYCGTDTRVDGLLIGVAVAAAIRAGVLPSVGRVYAVLGAAVLGLCAGMAAGGAMFLVWLPLLVSLGTVPILLRTLDTPGLLGAAWLRWVGRRAYGIYLWQMPVVQVARHFELSWPVAVLVVVPAVLVVAELSWRLIEVPAQRRWRGRGQPTSPQTSAIATGPGGAIPLAS